MSSWPIRVRLALWFALVLGLVLLASAVTTWVSLRGIFNDTIDRSLEDRASSVGRFLDQAERQASIEELREDLREYVALDPGWNLLRISDFEGRELYASPAFEAGSLPRSDDALPEGGIVYRDLKLGGTPVRLAATRILAHGRPYRIQVAVPTRDVELVLKRFRIGALLLVPLGALVAGGGGYWISRRALAPVERIGTTLREITALRLDRRLEVPRTRDELQRLTVTLNEMLDRLEAAFRESGRFIADASHELRTPVSLIRTAAEVALRRPREAEGYRSTLREILREAERTSTLVQDLLTLTRADAGVSPLERQPFDLCQVLAGMREQLIGLAERGGLSLHVDLPPGPVPIVGDRAAMSRLVVALVDNAVKYTPAPGSVAVTVASQAHGGAVLEVADSGIGIAEADLPRVFDRFYRADKARSREAGGAGLGLSIARWIVVQHRGHIRIDSEPGKGSRVVVELPVAGPC